MSKIIVVGHKSIDLTPLNTILGKVGVAQANFKDKKPEEIDTIINTVLETSAVNNVKLPEIWNGLALDLLLANIDQPIWGWSNPDALPVLDFWKNVDPNFSFLFSYDNPSLILRNTSDENSIEEKIHEWVNYYQSTLDFYLNNRERSILLNQQRFNNDINSAVSLLGQNIKGLSYHQIEESLNNGLLLEQDRTYSIQDKRSDQEPKELVSEYILRDVIQQFPEAIDLYEKLQSVADLPLDEKEIIARSPAVIWHSYNKVQKESEEAYESLKCQLTRIQKELGDENHTLLDQMHWAQEEVERLFNRNLSLKAELENSKEEVKSLNEAQKENVSKIDWLRREKDKYKKERNDSIGLISKLEMQIANLTKECALNVKASEKIKQILAEKEKEALKKQHIEQEKYEQLYVRKNILIKKLQDDLALEKEKSLKKIHILQEEYEKLFFDQKNSVRKLKEELSLEKETSLERIHKVQESFEHYYISTVKAQNSKPLGAAQRIKDQLGYRVGETLIKKGKSVTGVVFMPFYLMGTYSSYRKMLKKRKKEKKLPPIESYQDFNDTKKIKSHLSYTLGNYFVSNIKKPWKWAVMPFGMYKVVRDFHNKAK